MDGMVAAWGTTQTEQSGVSNELMMHKFQVWCVVAHEGLRATDHSFLSCPFQKGGGAPPLGSPAHTGCPT